ncbi:RNA polymerase sigma factor [Candidatus Uabimicrobium amorphum]|uniref:RNA polymerase sigma factor n=1 Tax=Uabimicrobium amorphum TaxID=2596890 RepID=A0A5S9IR70_UABAM|nr:sigma-70 family RNA polymerase sigma factor [Candidatus Uabimicrobium amorphum]BBM86080.1 RNA polymerase sigma factor [Candidatus Uabimicrobium amorphum]
MLEDNDLVELFNDGEAQAFEILVERYSSRIINFIYRLCWQRELAEDLAQEVFIKLYRNLSRYECSGKFSAYIFTIAKNIWIDFLRSKRGKTELSKRKTHEIIFENIKSKEPSAEEMVYYKEKLELLQTTINELSEEQRMVFMLYHDDMKYAEIAEILSIPEGTVKSRLHHAFQKIKKALFEE